MRILNAIETIESPQIITVSHVLSYQANKYTSHAPQAVSGTVQGNESVDKEVRHLAGALGASSLQRVLIIPATAIQAPAIISSERIPLQPSQCQPVLPPPSTWSTSAKKTSKASTATSTPASTTPSPPNTSSSPSTTTSS